MVDIHCHLLFGVDDGADSLEESVEMLKVAKKQGIDYIILTPHYRHGMFPYEKDKIEQNFKSLKPYADKLEIGIFLGTEYHVDSHMIESYRSGRCYTLAGTRNILMEYSHSTEYGYIRQMTEEALRCGYFPIIAHCERYACLVEEPERAEELLEMGARIQVNADAVLGLEGRGPKKYCKRLLSEGWVSIIASDCHGIKKRACHMEECRKKVAKKYGESYARELFEITPRSILKRE